MNSSFTASYKVKVHPDTWPRNRNPDVRFCISICPEKCPYIEVIFPWEYSEIDRKKYECHIDYFPGTGEGDYSLRRGGATSPRIDSGRTGGPTSHYRLQQISVAHRVVGSPVSFDVFVSFYWPNLVFESTLFEDQIDRLCVSLSSLRSKGYPIHLAQYIGFRSINSRVTVEHITLKEVLL